MFHRKDKGRVTGTEVLTRAVAEQLPDADEDTRTLVVSVCGLIAAVVFVDRQYKDAEEAHVRRVLSSIGGLTSAGVDAICHVLRTHITDLATLNPQQHTRALRDDTDVEFRREILDILVDLAAADDALTLIETDLLRRTTTALGLEQDDYVHAQARHRDKVKLLK
jgi:uncharacterized tellurite resistance protein B-like protein